MRGRSSSNSLIILQWFITMTTSINDLPKWFMKITWTVSTKSLESEFWDLTSSRVFRLFIHPALSCADTRPVASIRANSHIWNMYKVTQFMALINGCGFNMDMVQTCIGCSYSWHGNWFWVYYVYQRDKDYVFPPCHCPLSMSQDQSVCPPPPSPGWTWFYCIILYFVDL